LIVSTESSSIVFGIVSSVRGEPDVGMGLFG
jgi:hypothetical protein